MSPTAKSNSYATRDWILAIIAVILQLAAPVIGVIVFGISNGMPLDGIISGTPKLWLACRESLGLAIPFALLLNASFRNRTKWQLTSMLGIATINSVVSLFLIMIRSL